MSENKRYILMADYVPLANKGEEAIIRGIEDLLGDDRPVEMAVFDNVEEVVKQGNMTVFPRNWVFTYVGVKRPHRRRVLKMLMMSLQMRLGYYGRLRNLISSRASKFHPLREFFDRAEYILAGHDGAFSIEACAVVCLAKKAGKRTGIFGAGFVDQRYLARISWLVRRAVQASDFFTLRDRHSYKGIQELIQEGMGRVRLAPDPAFAMRPAAQESARAILDKAGVLAKAAEGHRPIVAATVLEKGVVYFGFMPGASPATRRLEHAKYLAKIFDALIQERNALVVFLPHAVEADSSDLTAARNVAAQMQADSDGYVVLNEDLDARHLKAVIREVDFLVGERTHSLIGSVSTGTPFAALTNQRDLRTLGIIGDMCGCQDQVVDMNNINSTAAGEKILNLFDNRNSIAGKLRKTQERLLAELHDVADFIKGVKGAERSQQG